jgi:hypothetical protein
MPGASTARALWHGQTLAGVGVPGLSCGHRTRADFRTLGGFTETAGAQWSPAEHWALGGQLIDAHDVSFYSGTARHIDDQSLPFAHAS